MGGPDVVRCAHVPGDFFSFFSTLRESVGTGWRTDPRAQMGKNVHRGRARCTEG
jgi:hypothetical protein